MSRPCRTTQLRRPASVITLVRPLTARDFSGLTALLLVATIVRLAIDESMTRLVLLRSDAGAVVTRSRSSVIGGQRRGTRGTSYGADGDDERRSRLDRKCVNVQYVHRVLAQTPIARY